MLQLLTVIRHRLNILFETGRGHQRALLSVAVDEHRIAHHRRAVDPSNESGGLGLSETHGVRFISGPFVTQIDVLVSTRQLAARPVSDGQVIEAGGVGDQRPSAKSGICEAGGVGDQRPGAAGRVEIADGIVKERSSAAGGVSKAGGIVEKRPGPADRVAGSGGVRTKRVEAASRVVVTGAVRIERVDAPGRVAEAGGV